MQDQVTSLGTTVAASAGMLEMSLETQQNALRGAIDTASQSLEERLRDNVGTLAVRLSDAASEIGRSADAFSNRIRQTVGGVQGALEETGSRIESTFGGLEGRIRGEILEAAQARR